MIRFEEVQVSPNPVIVGGNYIIRVKATSVPGIFRFPLAIPKILGIIFKKRGSS